MSEEAYVDAAESFLNLDLDDDSKLAEFFMKLRRMNRVRNLNSIFNWQITG